ncbi:DHA2 family efflux MFS transporter permease subunit [Fructobacillus sp. M1-13]|uniref:Multidrug efflux MFS transporter n=1 Tax=Fructobacillus papyriferae TaxID=2713171 RepID=A0ABS5QQ16_9LACO|nr:DHA2 family efflux MFS transporter permease subunit [Fructobacillus papyriferae]MBS9335278.1 multidrug efflux MFS transporter [Fructobacillus papyriferae]MCD2159053.1 DHA2 family efflux MFS transporter permease subunit [Fructobacillus papyriferae]
MEAKTSYNRWVILGVLMIAAMSGALMQTSLGTALPTLMTAFHIDLATAQQATTWFLLVNGMMIPLTAYLANRIKNKVLHMIAYSLLLIGVGMSMLTPEQSDMWWIFVAGRIIAAMAVGIMMPMLQVLIINMFKKEERGAAMGLMGLVVGMSPAIGPTLTGWILEKNHTILGMTLSNSWRSIFVIPFIIIVLATIAAPFLLKNVMEKKKLKLDFLSLVLSVAGFGLFLWGFTNVAADGWGDFARVIAPIGAGVLLLVAFAWRQLKLPVPFLDVRVFAKKEFTIPTVALLLATMAMYGVEMMLPTYLQNIRGLSALDSGITLMWGALFMGLMSPVAGILYNKVGVKAMSFFGFGILALGTVPYVFLNTTTPTVVISVLYAIRMAGIAIVMMPLTTTAMSALPDEKAADGTAANNTLRQVSSSVVVALLTSVVQNVINNNTPSASLKATDPIQYASQALNASMDGFQTAFLISLVFAILGFIFVFFMKGQTKEEK